MNRLSGGSSASSRSIQPSSLADILVRHSCFGDALRDFFSGIASRAPSPKRSRWICSTISINWLSGRPRRLGAHETQPRIQFVDFSAQSTRGSDLRPGCRRRGPCRPHRRSWCRFSRFDYGRRKTRTYTEKIGRKGQLQPRSRCRIPTLPGPAPRRCSAGAFSNVTPKRARYLPWRLTRDPYSILVSEVMLGSRPR